ncbi:hypothetical protein NFI96_022777, partial [Prochilodus magdalenae]
MGLGLALLLSGVGLLSVTMCSQPIITLVVEPGDNVTLWYHYQFTGREECIHWLKQANNSVPELLLSVCNIPFETPFDEHSRVKDNTIPIGGFAFADEEDYYDVDDDAAAEVYVDDDDDEADPDPGARSSDIFFTLTVIFGVLSVTVGSQTTLMLEVEAGDDVTLWCNHSLEEPAHISWYKHTNTSVPERLTCQQYSLYAPPRPCSIIPQSNRTVMSVNSENASLHITGVSSTDSGLYYCCTQRNQHITFTNATLLLVKGQNESLFRNSSR